MSICSKHYLSNTCSPAPEIQFIKKLSNTEAELKKALLIKKACGALLKK